MQVMIALWFHISLSAVHLSEASRHQSFIVFEAISLLMTCSSEYLLPPKCGHYYLLVPSPAQLEDAEVDVAIPSLSHLVITSEKRLQPATMSQQVIPSLTLVVQSH
jgi:hypothetical protein